MKVFSIFAGVLSLGLLCGCAFTEFKTERPPVKDDRITFVENGNFGLKPLTVVTKIDDEGCLNADVTFELGGSPFFTWYFCGAPMQTLVYRFDWVDAKGNVLQGKTRKVEILPGNILTVGAIAPDEKYKNFKFEVSFNEGKCEKACAAKCEKKAEAKAVKKASAKKAAVKPAKKASAKKAAVKPAKKAPAKKAAVKPAKKASAKKAAVKPAKKAPARGVKKVPATSASAMTKNGKLAESMD